VIFNLLNFTNLHSLTPIQVLHLFIPSQTFSLYSRFQKPSTLFQMSLPTNLCSLSPLVTNSANVHHTIIKMVVKALTQRFLAVFMWHILILSCILPQARVANITVTNQVSVSQIHDKTTIYTAPSKLHLSPSLRLWPMTQYIKRSM
jgi:hypothetical protein